MRPGSSLSHLTPHVRLCQGESPAEAAKPYRSLWWLLRGGLSFTVNLSRLTLHVSHFLVLRHSDWVIPEDTVAASLQHRNLSAAAANKKEPILGLLEDLDVEVEPSRPVDWTVSICSPHCGTWAMPLRSASFRSCTPAGVRSEHLQVKAPDLSLWRGNAQLQMFSVSLRALCVCTACQF